MQATCRRPLTRCYAPRLVAVVATAGCCCCFCCCYCCCCCRHCCCCCCCDCCCSCCCCRCLCCWRELLPPSPASIIIRTQPVLPHYPIHSPTQPLPPGTPPARRLLHNYSIPARRLLHMHTYKRVVPVHKFNRELCTKEFPFPLEGSPTRVGIGSRCSIWGTRTRIGLDRPVPCSRNPERTRARIKHVRMA